MPCADQCGVARPVLLFDRKIKPIGNHNHHDLLWLRTDWDHPLRLRVLARAGVPSRRKCKHDYFLHHLVCFVIGLNLLVYLGCVRRLQVLLVTHFCSAAVSALAL